MQFKHNKVYVLGRHLESHEIPSAAGLKYPIPDHEIPVELFCLPKKSFYQFHTVSVKDVYPYYEPFPVPGKGRGKKAAVEEKEIDKTCWSSSYKDNMQKV